MWNFSGRVRNIEESPNWHFVNATRFRAARQEGHRQPEEGFSIGCACHTVKFNTERIMSGASQGWCKLLDVKMRKRCPHFIQIHQGTSDCVTICLQISNPRHRFRRKSVRSKRTHVFRIRWWTRMVQTLFLQMFKGYLLKAKRIIWMSCRYKLRRIHLQIHQSYPKWKKPRWHRHSSPVLSRYPVPHLFSCSEKVTKWQCEEVPSVRCCECTKSSKTIHLLIFHAV